MSVQSSVQAYIEQQPKLAWRRWLLRGFIRAVGFGALWRIDVHGTEHIPPDQPTILMINHITGIDPIVVMGAVQHRYAIPMTKIENTRNPMFSWAVWWYGAYTVNRGEVDRSALLNSIELLKSGQLVLISPEGTRHPTGLTEPKDGLAYVATKADAVIVPTAISGAIGWEDSLKRLRRHSLRIDFGRAFRFDTQGQARVPRDRLALMTQEAMYQLALTLPDPALRGAYQHVENATTDTLSFVE